jgi:hypothetical protein
MVLYLVKHRDNFTCFLLFIMQIHYCPSSPKSRNTVSALSMSSFHVSSVLVKPSPTVMNIFWTLQPASSPMATGGSFLVVKRLEREADHSSPSCADIYQEYLELCVHSL